MSGYRFFVRPGLEASACPIPASRSASSRYQVATPSTSRTIAACSSSTAASPSPDHAGDLPEVVAGILHETALPPDRVELEVTESVQGMASSPAWALGSENARETDPATGARRHGDGARGTSGTLGQTCRNSSNICLRWAEHGREKVMHPSQDGNRHPPGHEQCEPGKGGQSRRVFAYAARYAARPCLRRRPPKCSPLRCPAY